MREMPAVPKAALTKSKQGPLVANVGFFEKYSRTDLPSKNCGSLRTGGSGRAGSAHISSSQNDRTHVTPMAMEHGVVSCLVARIAVSTQHTYTITPMYLDYHSCMMPCARNC